MRLRVKVVRSFWGELDRIGDHLSKEARGLRVGDAIIFSMGKRKIHKKLLPQFVEDGYRFVSPRLQGQYTHTGIYVGDGKIVEALDEGIREVSLDSVAKKKSFFVVSPKKANAEQREAAASWARGMVGQDYSDKSMMGAALSLISSRRGLVNRKFLGKGKVSRKEAQCGGLVMGAWASSKISVRVPTADRYAAPVDILLSPDTKITHRKSLLKHLAVDPERVPFTRVRGEYVKKLRIKPSLKNRAGYAGWQVAKAAPAVGAVGLAVNQFDPTADRIHDLAKSKGIESDSRLPGSGKFLAMSRDLTGKEHLDKMTKKDRRRVYAALLLS
tara:strand:- start:309 stop:1292 length:984 start_codon:yes stop_codon:yes gene_type:complete